MRCRLCGCQDTVKILDLGNVPLANAFLETPDSPEERFPLSLSFCPKCSLVQLTETVDPEKLFRNYNYFSSISNEMLKHAKDLVDDLVVGRKLDHTSQVIELASNDGYLLKNFLPYGIPVLGIDPAKNVAKIAEENGVPTVTEFFDDKLASHLPQADVVIALNVVGHTKDPVAFMCGINKVLKPNGVAIVEVPSARNIIDEMSFDTIYHEHINYWSLNSLKNLCKWGMMTISRVEPIDIHGGGYRIYITHDLVSYDRQTNQMFEIESALGLTSLPYYRCFANRVKDNVELYRNMLCELKSQGKRIIGYGAAAKGVQMLNALKLDKDAIEYVVDATPIKQGKFMPGSRIPIVSPAEFGTPDVVWVLAWNWVSEIMSKHPDFDGDWLTLLPKVQFL